MDSLFIAPGGQAAASLQFLTSNPEVPSTSCSTKERWVSSTAWQRRHSSSAAHKPSPGEGGGNPMPQSRSLIPGTRRPIRRLRGDWGWVGPITRNLALRRLTMAVMPNTAPAEIARCKTNSRPLPIDNQRPGLFAELITRPVHTLNPDGNSDQQPLATPAFNLPQRCLGCSRGRTGGFLSLAHCPIPGRAAASCLPAAPKLND